MCQQLYTSTIQNPNTKITCNTNGLVNIILGFPFEGILIDWQIIDALCWPHFRFRHKQMMFLQLGKELVNFQKLWNPKSNFQHLKRNTKKFPAFSSPSPPSHLTPQASSFSDTKKGSFWRKVQRMPLSRLCCQFLVSYIKRRGSPIFSGLAFHTAPTEFTDNRIFLKVLRILNKEHRSQHFRIVCQFKLGKKNSEGQLGIGTPRV